LHYEVIAIREGRLTMTHLDFSKEEADEIIAYLVTLFNDTNPVSAHISVFI